MSGRLVILRHKSWHVWNADNREKVMRDEREHAEEVEADRHKRQRLEQERNLELLRSGKEITEEDRRRYDEEDEEEEKRKKKSKRDKKDRPRDTTLDTKFGEAPSSSHRKNGKEKEETFGSSSGTGKNGSSKPWYLLPPKPIVKERAEINSSKSGHERNESVSKMESNTQSIDIEELRKKRLAREAAERKKASLLKAQRDIYG